ncbi:MAG: GNAT family N-acetyltransferase [Acidovorax sp.]|jgi:predicted N-acyltransferase|nr:GNAT family N-acetyltransferase [Acidovorax sp.]
MTEKPIITRVFATVQEIAATAWDALLAQQATPTPFMRHAYLAALQESGSASTDSGWDARCITLWQQTPEGEQLLAACPLYVKHHSWGEYVFDMAWARAYHEHGLAYYPKAVVAVPFTPVPGSRLLASNPQWRLRLVQTVQAWCAEQGLSSAHVLFGDAADHAALAQAGWIARAGVQFHWKNMAPTLPTACGSLPPEGAVSALGRPGSGWAPTLPAARVLAATDRLYVDFDDFLASLQQVKRKKIRQERQKVAQAGVQFSVRAGREISEQDWDFFYACYARTYVEHGNPPYLQRDFFTRMARDLPGHWVLFIAERDGRRMACSLIAVSADATPASVGKPSQMPGVSALAATEIAEPLRGATAYGRYWGALERVDCLHFEACYYQPLQWCIAQGLAYFEGGAQGEHKMARALLPVATASYHWLSHPAFADAVERFLQREGEGMAHYMQELEQHSPLRQAAPQIPQR